MIGVWGAIDFDWPSRRPRRRPPPLRSRRRTRRQVGTRRRRRRTNATCRLSLFCLFRDDDDARVERCNFPINLQVGRGGRSARERLEPLDAFASRLNRPLSIGRHVLWVGWALIKDIISRALPGAWRMWASFCSLRSCSFTEMATNLLFEDDLGIRPICTFC